MERGNSPWKTTITTTKRKKEKKKKEKKEDNRFRIKFDLQEWVSSSSAQLVSSNREKREKGKQNFQTDLLKQLFSSTSLNESMFD